jgi:prepilin-type N-terminal cleavage/methylation domain-containing protein
MKKGFTLIELVVVMSLMAFSAVLVIMPALVGRRGQLEASQLVKEVLSEIRYAQSLSKGVIWEGEDADFRPKIIYSEVYMEDGNIVVENKGYGLLGGAQSTKAATRKFEKQGARIKKITTTSGFICDSVASCDDKRLIIAFSVPRGETTVKDLSGTPNSTNFSCPSIEPDGHNSIDPCKLTGSYSGEIEVVFLGEKDDEEIILIIDTKTGKMNV